MYLLDTSVAILVRDGAPGMREKLSQLSPMLLSIVTRVELEGGVHRAAADSKARRARLDALLRAVPTIPFDDACASEYGEIVASAGYSRRKLLDRMIASQALVHGATLITRNAQDFADIPGLSVLVV
jgi:tRNA(fMet)-specific endonuclease VapC